MYQISLSCSSEFSEKYGLNSRMETCFLETSDEVCYLLSKLPKGIFVSLIEIEFSNIDDVVLKFSSK